MTRNPPRDQAPGSAPSDARLPVFVLTGFLGSGKTTLLNALLRDPGMSDSAVVINEFGEIGIDHLLVETATEDTVLLRSGCVCCSVRGDLVDTLSDLHWRRETGDLPPFRRVIVETSGLADPGPILQTLMTDRALTGVYRLGSLVTVVDAVHGAAQLDRQEEALRQAALADRIVLSKTDLAVAAEAEFLRERLRRLNPLAPIVARDAVDAAALLAEDDAAARTIPGAAAGYDGHGHDHDDVSRHDGIRAFAVAHDAPLDWDLFRDWLESIVSLRGADILRIKGIVHAHGSDLPVAVHGVHHVFHPPETLPRWPEGARRTQLVFITRDYDLSGVGQALDALSAMAAAE